MSGRRVDFIVLSTTNAIRYICNGIVDSLKRDTRTRACFILQLSPFQLHLRRTTGVDVGKVI